ncbi:MAG: single-stranded DNA-binding protein [candidate division Zixibacteria bacterium]|nr:single-stranded DNA-binding protein [candidate division Zixibacteria bacterium]
MASVNKAILIGNLGRDPELRYTPSGKAVASFSIATTEKWRDQNGEMQESTEWHNIVLWGRQAEIAKEYLAKGRPVYIEGRIQTRSYEDKNGVKKYMTEIVGQRMQFLGSRGDTSSDYTPPPPPKDDDAPFNNTVEDDDLPF